MDCQLEGAAKSGEQEEENKLKLKFRPPLSIQRYKFVARFLKNEIGSESYGSSKCVIDIGSSDCKLFEYLKFIRSLDMIVMLDIDKETLEKNRSKIEEVLANKSLKVKRKNQSLRVEVYAGCVTRVDTRILNIRPQIYAAVAIEVIEHLNPDVLTGFETTLFATIRPKIIIVTTPNSEFNVAFGLAKGRFRHWDHKFEWTRVEFKLWCEKICSEYPIYNFNIDGIGTGPEQFSHLGHATQAAVFRKNEDSVFGGNEVVILFSIQIINFTILII